MAFGPPQPHSSQDEIEQTLRRGESKLERRERPLTVTSVAVVFGWAALLVLVAAVLIGLGLIDPEMCRGTMNPASC